MPKTLTEAQYEKVERVMHEWGKGALKSSSGKRVAGQKQALAIAYNEARRRGK